MCIKSSACFWIAFNKMSATRSIFIDWHMGFRLLKITMAMSVQAFTWTQALPPWSWYLGCDLPRKHMTAWPLLLSRFYSGCTIHVSTKQGGCLCLHLKGPPRGGGKSATPEDACQHLTAAWASLSLKTHELGHLFISLLKREFVLFSACWLLFPLSVRRKQCTSCSSKETLELQLFLPGARTPFLNKVREEHATVLFRVRGCGWGLFSNSICVFSITSNSKWSSENMSKKKTKKK